jgi:hypothetical protein
VAKIGGANRRGPVRGTEEPALPELTTEVAVTNCSAADTAVVEERSLTVPVGFEPSNFARSRLTPRR